MSLSGYINRIRHNRGYGVQSPSAFFFVTEVLKEKLPYYAYAEIDKIYDKKGFFSKKHARDLFKITNYFSPASSIAVASPIASAIMALAKPSVHKYCIAKKVDENIKNLLDANYCTITEDNSVQALSKAIAKSGSVGILYIGKCQEQAALLDAALPFTNKKSIIVVEGINRSKESRMWWQKTIKDPRTIVTYDMYSYGILFFDNEKRKQNYTLKR